MDIRRFSYINYGGKSPNDIFVYSFEDRDGDYFVNGHRIYSDEIKYDLTRLLKQHEVTSWPAKKGTGDALSEESFDLEVSFHDRDDLQFSLFHKDVEGFHYFLHGMMDIFEPYVDMFCGHGVNGPDTRYLQSVGCCVSSNGNLFDYNLFEEVNSLFPNFHIMIIGDKMEEYTGNIENLSLKRIDDLLDDYQLIEKFGEEYAAHVYDLEEEDDDEYDGIILDLSYSDGSMVQIVQSFDEPDIENFTLDFISLMVDYVEENADKIVKSNLFEQDLSPEEDE